MKIIKLLCYICTTPFHTLIRLKFRVPIAFAVIVDCRMAACYFSDVMIKRCSMARRVGVVNFKQRASVARKLIKRRAHRIKEATINDSHYSPLTDCLCAVSGLRWLSGESRVE